MKKKPLLLMMILSALIACSDNKKYHITILEENGDVKLDSCMVATDSMAYLRGAEAFKGHTMAYIAMQKSELGKYLSPPQSFIVTDEKGIDVVKKLSPECLTNIAEVMKKLDNLDKDLKVMSSSTDKTSSKSDDDKTGTHPGTIDSAVVKSLMGKVSVHKDEFNEVDYIQPKDVPKYRNQNGMYFYFMRDKSGKPSNFRFTIQYAADDWLFISECKFLVDGKPFNYSAGEFQRDNGYGGIWEWNDSKVSSYDEDLVQALANAKTAKVRLEGSQYYKEKTITAQQIKSFQTIYNLYKAMGGEL